MTRFASEAFWRVQRYSIDWHANNFAGAIMRRITRGMWAVDLMDNILLLEMLPALLVLVGTSLLLGWGWPGMGVMLAVGCGGWNEAECLFFRCQRLRALSVLKLLANNPAESKDLCIFRPVPLIRHLRLCALMNFHRAPRLIRGVAELL